MGTDPARRIVRDVVTRLGLARGRLDWRKGVIGVPLPSGKTEDVRLADLLKDTKECGIPGRLYSVSDVRDPLFGGILLALTQEAASWTVGFAGYEQKVSGPCRIAPAEQELVEDILFYRRAACLGSNDVAFEETARHYRAYLQTSVSLMDAFINRYVMAEEHLRPGSVPEELQRPGRMEERIDLWVKTFAPQLNLNATHATVEWSQFMEIKCERNRMTHAVEPHLGVGIKNLPKQLNNVRRGVGGLLAMMRENAGEGKLGFIERLRSAPLVEYRSRRAKRR